MLVVNKLSNHFVGSILSFIAGALLTFAFAPFKIFPLAILSPALLLACWLNVSPIRAFWRGYFFGIGLFATGVYWVFISIHTFGNAPAWLATVITIGFVFILALFPAINGYVLNRFFINNKTKIIYIFPVLWVFFEWIRSWIFSGFPWLFLGYSQINSPLKGYAPFLSVYAVSLAVVLTSALVVMIFLGLKEKNKKLIYFSVIGIILIWALGAILNLISWTKPVGKPVQISLVQGNIPQELKWVPDHVKPTLKLYQTLTEQHWDSKIIIWPEAAVPIPFQDAKDYLNHIASQALKHHTTVITGIFIKAPVNNDYYNSVVALGQGFGIYLKQRLVPFGEFTPMKVYLGKLLNFFDIPMSDVASGGGKPQPLIIGDIKIGVFICYEIAFPEQVRYQDGDIGMLLTVSNDAWFGHSIAQAQHLEMAQMRALELGRPILFVSNNGMTAFIDPSGKIHSEAPPFEQVVLTASMQPMQGKTPWQRYGMDPILLILIIGLILGWKRRE